MGVREVLTAPRSPWQNPYAERVIGSIRRECLDHIVVFNESSLRRTLKSYFSYYRRARTHLSLGKDAPQTRPIQPPELGSVVERSADCITTTRGERPEEAVPSGDSVLPSIAVDA
jgi:hypothetical protein